MRDTRGSAGRAAAGRAATYPQPFCAASCCVPHPNDTRKHLARHNTPLHPKRPRDPAKRPTAKEALSHPWLRGDSSERSAGKQIDASVVQRIQRFAQNSRFKRGVLRMIAEELLAHPGAAAALAASAAAQGGSAGEPAGGGGGSARGGAGGSGRRGAVDADSAALRELLRKLELDAAGAGAVDKARAAEAIAGMGFRLQPSELAQLVTMLDTSNSGKVRRAAVAASQIDFKHLQQSDADAWAEVARRVFSRLDADQDGGERRRALSGFGIATSTTRFCPLFLRAAPLFCSRACTHPPYQNACTHTLTHTRTPCPLSFPSHRP